MGMILKNWNIEEMTGYKPKTTFYMDFSIADQFGIDGVKDTYNRAFKEWKNDIEYVTELAMVMSWKSFEHEKNEELCKLYSDLYYKTDGYILDNKEKKFSDKDIQYYLQTTD